MSSKKCNVTVWHPSVHVSVCLSHWHTHRNSPEGSIRHDQHTFQLDSYSLSAAVSM